MESQPVEVRYGGRIDVARPGWERYTVLGVVHRAISLAISKPLRPTCPA